MKVVYTPSFSKQFKSLEIDLQNEVVEKIELFKEKKNHKRLKVHKLHGRLAGKYSFSVDHKNRIVFDYLTKNEALLLVIGDHDIYK